MQVTLKLVVPMLTKDIIEIYGHVDEDRACSLRCANARCNERLWMPGSWWEHEDELMECPKCKRLQVSPYLRREELITHQKGDSQP